MKLVRTLGIDPGHETGMAYMPNPRAQINIAAFSDIPTIRKERRGETGCTTQAIARNPDGELIWRTWTIRTDAKAPMNGAWPAWIDHLAREVATAVVAWEPDIVAIERFEHQGWRGRRISNEAEMGMCVAKLMSICESLGVTTISVAPKDTAANMDWIEKFVPTTHELRAIGAALWASGRTSG